MASPQLPSSPSQCPSSYNSTDTHGSQDASGTESTGDTRENRKKRGSNFLKRSQSTSAAPPDDRSGPRKDLQRSLTPPLVTEGTPIAQYFASLNSSENDSSQGWLGFGGFFEGRRSDTYPPLGFASGATTHFPNHIAQYWITSNKILFYNKHEPFYGFTNFSPHSVIYKGKKYPTSEHLFQSFKFAHKPKLAEHIRVCSPRPSVAFSEARRFAPEVREDWSDEKIKAMDITIYLKFTQNKDIRRQLLATGDAELIENSDKDSFWGCGADGKGQNELGKALERLRTRLRKERR